MKERGYVQRDAGLGILIFCRLLVWNHGEAARRGASEKIENSMNIVPLLP